MESAFETSTFPLENDSSFVTIFRAPSAARCVLFVAGRGGNPLRHEALLQHFASKGMTVVAPHFEMLASPTPTKAELLERGRRLVLAMNTCCRPGHLPVAGVGHSIGTVILLLLAGAEATTSAGDRLVVQTDRTLDRLVLLTPPTDFFRLRGALASIELPVQIWAGGKDTITPPAQAEFLKETLGAPAQLHVIDDAGHFTFMNEPPPHATDLHPDRAAFLRSLADETTRFLEISG